jgi:hypothetical protein
MARRDWILATTVILACVAAVVGLVLWLKARGKARSKAADQSTVQDEGRLPAAEPPSRPPTRGDKLLASLINAMDADARSIELGRWFLSTLRRYVLTMQQVDCATLAEAVPYERIVGAVPGINPVAKATAVGILRALVQDMAATCRNRILDPAEFVRVIDMYEASAFAKGMGVLWGMPGYAISALRPPPTVSF